MDFGARWDKIFHDIWDNRARSLLVIFSLAIGISAVGMINNAVRLMKRDLFEGFASTNPASIDIYVSPFQKELTNSISALREVERAEARRTVPAYIRDSKGDRHNLEMIAVPDLDQVQINSVTIDQGDSTPELRSILVERDTANKLKLSVGDRLPVEMEDGSKYELTISGIVHDMSTRHYHLSGNALGYLSMSTLEWMGEEPYYNQVKLVVSEDKLNREHVLHVAGIVRDRVIEPAGYQVLGMSISNSNGIPGDYWAKPQINGVLMVLQLMSVLAVLLCGGLVVNTISAVIVQQTRQIGIMRSVGANRKQIVWLYLGYVFVLSVIGLIIALPLGMIGAGVLSHIASNFMNYQVGPTDLPIGILLIQAGLGLLMPVGVALFPIMQGTHISVYDAIYQYGLISGENRRGWIERQLGNLRKIKPPVLLSLRNTFRNKSRLAFTLVTLTIAGATFMAVFSAYATLLNQINELGRYISFDAAIDIPGGANRYTAEREAMRIPDIKFAEGWALSSGFIVHPDGVESDRIQIVGLPENARTIQPHIVKGRWLLPTDTSRIVINEDLLEKESGLRVGEYVEIKINDITRRLEIVGIASKHMMGSRIYMTENQFARLTGRQNQVDTIRVLGTPDALGSTAEQDQIGKELEKRFDDAKLSQSSSQTRAEIFSAMTNSFNIILFILLLVAVILTVIGALGLTGTMGLNVLERTREIGVLRAVGASYFSVRQVVVVEGITIALISWIMSALISYPFGLILAQALVRTALGTQAVFIYSFAGPFVWMVIVVLIGIFSSLAPARDAARLTVREVLSYE